MLLALWAFCRLAAVDMVLLLANFLFFVKDFWEINLQLIGMQKVTTTHRKIPTICFQG